SAQQTDLTRMIAETKDPALKEELRQALNRAKKHMPLSAKNMAFDGYGRQLKYMVSEAWTKRMVEDGSVPGANEQGVKLRNAGSIRVQDVDGNTIAPTGA